MIYYSVDLRLSKEEKLLVLCLGQKDAAIRGDEKTFFASTKNPGEQSLVKSLIEDEKKLDPKKKFFDSFRIRPGNVKSLLTQLAATGQLFIDKKRAILDLFSPIHLNIEAMLEGNEAIIQTTAKVNNSTFDLSLFDLIAKGKPHLAIKGSFIYFFDEDIDWDDLEILQQGLVSKESYCKWKKETSLTFKSDESEEKKKPRVTLQDNRGLFANACLLNGTDSAPLDPHHENILKEAGYQRKQVGASQYFCPQDQVIGSLVRLLERGWEVYDNTQCPIRAITEQSLSFTMKDNVIEITGRIRMDDEEASTTSYLQAVKEGRIFVKSEGTTVGLITQTTHASLAQDIEFVSGKPILKKRLLGLVGDKISATEQPRERKALTETDIENCFIGSLRPYQEEGVRWMQALSKEGFGGILADDMGLGKTIQAIAFLATLPQHSLSLIVCPTTLIHNWIREIQRFFPKASVVCYHGSERKQEPLPAAGIIVTSYGTLRQDIERISGHQFTAAVFDEAQMMKNEASDTAQAIFRIKTHFSLSMTGTPIENSPRELFTQFHMAVPGLLERREIDAVNDPVQVQRIRKIIRPFILRRKKEEVAKDLPPLIDHVLLIDMHETEKLQYEKAEASLKFGTVEKYSIESGEKQPIEVLESILRLRQLACHPLLVEQLAVDNHYNSSKFEQALLDIETLVREDKKIIVFSQFATMLTLFTKEAMKRTWPYLLLDGSTKNRQEIVDRFQNENIQLLFMTMKAGGVGLNLTAADAILLYDPWWNKAQEEQAISRSHRIGRIDSVLVKRYITSGTIEESIMKLQQEKKKLADELLEGL